jgi:hypothetical protein
LALAPFWTRNTTNIVLILVLAFTPQNATHISPLVCYWSPSSSICLLAGKLLNSRGLPARTTQEGCWPQQTEIWVNVAWPYASLAACLLVIGKRAINC